MNRRPRRRHVPLPARTEERAHRRQLRLSQAGRELADRDHAPHSRQFRRDRDRQHRRQAVSNPPRLAVLRHPARKLVVAPQSVRPRRLGASRRKPPPLAVLGPPKSRPSATRQLSHQHRLRRTVLPPAAPRYPRIAARLAENPPIRRQAARPRVPARVHERLSQKNRIVRWRSGRRRDEPSASGPPAATRRHPLHRLQAAADRPRVPAPEDGQRLERRRETRAGFRPGHADRQHAVLRASHPRHVDGQDRPVPARRKMPPATTTRVVPTRGVAALRTTVRLAPPASHEHLYLARVKPQLDARHLPGDSRYQESWLFQRMGGFRRHGD